MPKVAYMQYEYGVMAAFSSAEGLRNACRELNRRGIGPWEAFSPYPEEGVQEMKATGKRLPVSRFVLLGSAGMVLIGYAILYYSSVIDYPYRVGGKGVHSWSAFIPLCFELAVLGGAVAAVGLALFGNGMPRWAHPVFFFEGFETASGTGRFLWVESVKRQEVGVVEAILKDCGATGVERREPEA